jgi:hypothetical protein
MRQFGGKSDSKRWIQIVTPVTVEVKVVDEVSVVVIDTVLAPGSLVAVVVGVAVASTSVMVLW